MRRALLVLLFLIAACSFAQTPTPTPPPTTQISGLPATTVTGTDYFVVDKDVSGVRRTRRVGSTDVLSYIIANYLGIDINDEELAAEDYGDFTCDGNEDGCLIDPNAVALGTDTTGNYVESISCGAGITGCVAASEGATPTLASSLGEDINDEDLAAEDFGFFTCDGNEDGCSIDDNTVTSAKIVNGTVTGDDVNDGSIAEVDLNFTNSPTVNYCLTSDGSSGFTWALCGTGAAGSDTQLQYNNSGALGGANAFTFSGGALHATGDFEFLPPSGTNTSLLTFSPAGGSQWSLRARGSDDYLHLFSNSAAGTLFHINNTGAGVANVTIDGTLTAGTVVGANVTSGADPGHTHTGGSLATDIIAEGNSNVEVIDAGTGQVVTRIDGVTKVTTGPAETYVRQRLMVDNDIESIEGQLKLGSGGAEACITNTGSNTLTYDVDCDSNPDVGEDDLSVDDDSPDDDSEVPDAIKAATSDTAAADDSDISIATTAFVQQEINGAGGRSLTCAGGTCDVDQEAWEQSRCINVDPAHTTTNWLFFRAERALTIVGVDCIVDAATSVVMTPRECDGDGANCSDIEAAMTCGTTNTAEATSVDNASIDAGDWVRVTRGTLTGSATQAILCVTYTVAD